MQPVDALLAVVDAPVLERLGKVLAFLRVSTKNGKKLKRKDKLRMLEAMDSAQAQQAAQAATAAGLAADEAAPPLPPCAPHLPPPPPPPNGNKQEPGPHAGPARLLPLPDWPTPLARLGRPCQHHPPPPASPCTFPHSRSQGSLQQAAQAAGLAARLCTCTEQHNLQSGPGWPASRAWSSGIPGPSSW